MLQTLRGKRTPREGAGPLPAPVLNLGQPPDQSYYLPPHTYTLGRMCARRGRGNDMSRTSNLRRPLAALLMAAALAASVVMAVVVLASPAWAATYTVTNNADSGEGSLRQAIIDANTSTGVADTINFELGSSAATITLTSSLPPITDGAGLTIDGGSADVTISGASQYRVFEVGPGAKLTLSNLTVANGADATASGGG